MEPSFGPDAGERLVDAEAAPEEIRQEASLRPRSFAEYVGQQGLLENLKVYVEAARRRGGALDHVLLAGAPGLGKTSLAHVLATELGTRIRTTSGPAIERAGDLASLLTSLEPGDLLFIDEIHRLGTVVEEVLYPAMEDFALDLTIGQGPAARSVRVELPPFTLVGATTRSGLLSAPLRDRFGIIERFRFYPPPELREILERAAARFELAIEDDAAREVASRARGTPRVALRLLRRLRDFADVHGSGVVTLGITRDALQRLGIDELGLDGLDRRMLSLVIDAHDGGPVGLGTIAASLGEETDTIEEIAEPFLLQIGFIERTPRGRVVTNKARRHLDGAATFDGSA